MGAAQTVSAAVTIQPTASQAADTFVYQAMPTFDFDGSGFDRFLVLGKSVAGHELDGLIRFDVAGVTLSSGESATLNLFVDPTESTGFPGVSPSSTGTAIADVALATSYWDPATVQFGQVASGAEVASQTVFSTGSWVSFDVTSAVQQWLADPGSNYGFILTQDAPVYTSGWVGLVFEGSAGANRPFLQISEAPEPSSMAIAASGLALVARRRRG